MYLSIHNKLDDQLNSAVIDCSTQCGMFQWSIPTSHLIDPSQSCNIVICDQTGSGKTHNTRIVGAIEQRLTCTIIPLLSLSIDQLGKFKGANQSFGTVEAHHIDDLFKESPSKYNKLLQYIRKLQRCTNSTIFFYSYLLSSSTVIWTFATP